MEKVKVMNMPFGPFPTAIVGAAVNGKPNYVTVGACGVVCQKPVLYASVKNSHYTASGLRMGGSFSLNIPSVQLMEKTDYCGIVTGAAQDKSEVFTAFYDAAGDAPMAGECAMNFLCKVIQEVEVFDFTMYIGEIVAAYVSEECMTQGKPDPKKIDPMILMGASYWSLHKQVGSVYKEGGKHFDR